MKNTLLAAVAVLLSLGSSAQVFYTPNPIEYPPNGEEVELFSGETQIATLDRRLMKVTTKAVYTIDTYSGPGSNSSSGFSKIYTAPPGTDIVDARFKFVSAGLLVANGHNILVLLSDNTVVQLVLGQGGYIEKQLDPIPTTQSNPSLQLIGDDLYAMTYDAVFVSDSGYNWTIDTAGLGNPFAYYDIDIDSNQKVWLCCSNGLFSQELNVTTWVKNTNYTPPGSDVVFIDRAQRIWVSYFNTIKVSSDGGQSFQNSPSGLFSGYIREISDDVFGNIYVMWDNRLYFSQGGTQPFVRIDQPVTADFALSPSTTVLNHVFGDSLVFLSTDAGVYTSADQGTTWTYTNEERAEHINSVAATANNRLLMTTNTGLFRTLTDTTWSKRYPSTGFMPDTKVYTATNGDIYLLAEKVGNNSGSSSVKMVYKSTNNGNSFTPDTTGAKAADVAMSNFFTDESGTQHAAASVAGGNALLVWKKLPGQPWALDTAGLPAMNFNYSVDCIGSDNSGKVYIAIGTNGITTVYSRPVAGSGWASETVINGSVFSLKGRNNVATIASNAGVSYNTGSGWQTIPRPAGVSPFIDWCLTEVDNNGVIWAYYEVFDNANIGEGIYFTADYTNWSSTFADIDTILFGELFAIGDSVFATTSGNDGVYVFDTTSATPTAIKPIATQQTDVRVLPNPTSGNTTLQFSLEKQSNVQLLIYNVLGETVYEVPLQTMNAGAQQLNITLPPSAKGTLLYNLVVNKKLLSGKIVRE